MPAEKVYMIEYIIQKEENARSFHWIIASCPTFSAALRGAVFSQHFWISFADIPLPWPPCLCAVPYGESSFNVNLESRWKRRDSQKWFARIGRAYPSKTRMFQWKRRYLRQQDLPYGTAHRQGVPQLQTKFDENQNLENLKLSTEIVGTSTFTPR